MIAIPSLEVRHGLSALSGGAQGQEHLRSASVSDHMRSLMRFGFARFHIDDVDALTRRRGRSQAVTQALSEQISTLQVAIGARRSDEARDVLSAGASFVVVRASGTADDEWLIEFANDEPGTLIVALDVSARRILARGKSRHPKSDPLDWIEEVQSAALAGILVNSVDSSGCSERNDFALLEEIVEEVGCPVLAAGKIAGTCDLYGMRDRGISATLLGNVLLEGLIDPWMVAQEFSA